MEQDLNKLLSDMYSDLEKLQSAREQVVIVTENSKDLTNATSNLLKELREFSNQFGKESSSNISQLSTSLNDFEKKINTISEKGNKLLFEYIDSFKQQIDNVAEKFAQQIAIKEKALNDISNHNNENIAKKIEEFKNTTRDLKINAEKGIEEIKALAISKIEIQEQNISKIIVNIEVANSKNIELINTIKEFDIPNNIEKINNKLETQNKLNKKLIVVIFSLLGIIGIIAFGLIVKIL